MISEYNKGGSFKEYIDKAVKCNGTSPEIECEKVIAKEYLKSLKKGGCNENTIRDADSRDHTEQDRNKFTCDC